MTQDTRWRVDDVIVDGILSGQPTWTIGGTETIEFYVGGESIDGRPTNDRAHEFTLGGALGATMGSPLPATIGAAVRPTVGGARPREDVYFTVAETPFGKLQRLSRYAGSATTEMSVDGVPIIRETIPARADRDTFVMAIEPVGTDVVWGSGAWVLVTDATDTSVVADRDAWLSIKLTVHVLAPLTEYTSKEELEAELSPPVTPD